MQITYISNKTGHTGVAASGVFVEARVSKFTAPVGVVQNFVASGAQNFISQSVGDGARF